MNLYTDRTKVALQLAREEAVRLKFDYIGVEHLLLGIIKEGNGVAVNALNNLGINLSELVLSIEKSIADKASGTGQLLPMTPRAKKVLEMAQFESRALSHGFVGTEHILLAIIKDSDSDVAQLLGSMNGAYDIVKNEIMKILRGDKIEDEGPVDTISDEMKSLSEVLIIVKRLHSVVALRVLEYCRQYVSSNPS